MIMVFDPDQRREPQEMPADADERLVRDAFAALPVVPCPDAVARRIERATGTSEPLPNNVRPAGPGATGPGTAAEPRRTRRRWLTAVGSVAAAAAISWLLLAGLGDRTVPVTPQLTGGSELVAGDIATDRVTSEARDGLALATRLLQRSEQILLKEALAKPLPTAVRLSLRKTVSLVQGGRG
jgi:hypothetical protein